MNIDFETFDEQADQLELALSPTPGQVVPEVFCIARESAGAVQWMTYNYDEWTENPVRAGRFQINRASSMCYLFLHARDNPGYHSAPYLVPASMHGTLTQDTRATLGALRQFEFVA